MADNETTERRHDGYQELAEMLGKQTDAVTAQGLRVAELSGRIEELSRGLKQQHEDTREDVDQLHEKVNKHVLTCGLEPRVKRMEIAMAGKAAVFTALWAIAVIIATALWAVIKEPVQTWLLMRYGGGKGA